VSALRSDHRTQDVPGGWQIEVKTDRRSLNDRPAPYELTLRWNSDRSSLPPGGITSSVLRSIKLGELIDEMQAGPAEIDLPPHWAQELRAGWTNSRQRKDDRLYALLALAYDVYVRSGDRSPRQRLTALMRCPRSTTDLRIAEARARGFLGTGSPGMPGGSLTESGRKVLGLSSPVI
jgi:hypothetical protein